MWSCMLLMLASQLLFEVNFFPYFLGGFRRNWPACAPRISANIPGFRRGSSTVEGVRRPWSLQSVAEFGIRAPGPAAGRRASRRARRRDHDACRVVARLSCMRRRGSNFFPSSDAACCSNLCDMVPFSVFWNHLLTANQFSTKTVARLEDLRRAVISRRAAAGRAQLLARRGHIGRVQNPAEVSENRPACGTAQHTLAVCFVFEKFWKNPEIFRLKFGENSAKFSQNLRNFGKNSNNFSNF